MKNLYTFFLICRLPDNSLAENMHYNLQAKHFSFNLDKQYNNKLYEATEI